LLRGLGCKAEDEQQDIDRQEKALADYRAQLGRSFEHETKLKDLLAKQAQLNAALDLDKHDTQTVAEAPEPSEKAIGFAGRAQAEGREAAMAP
jgi:hypothetical protein